jgi:hypothetical protein
MANPSRRQLSLGAVAALGLAVGCAAAPQRAQAEMINGSPVRQGISVVYGRQSDVISFDLSGPGTLQITLKDIGWPVKFDTLNLSVMSSHDVLGSLSSAGVLDVSIGQTGSYFAYFTAKAGTKFGVSLGMYAYDMEFRPATAPVPLPAAIRLLLSGLTLIGIVRQVWKGPQGSPAIGLPTVAT